MNQHRIGIVFNIQKFCTQDGPGIRTTVFLKGCPLRCKWCHNPESYMKFPSIGLLEEKCEGCQRCKHICPQNAHNFSKGQEKRQHQIERAKCIGCGSCVQECPTYALKLTGNKMTIDEIIEEVQKDMPFYELSGGGLTISGGEPFFQSEFSIALLKKAKEVGLHTCVETSGYVESEVILKAIPYIDLLLWDVKETNEVNHLEYTGGHLGKILANLDTLKEYSVPVILRCPIIPGINDRQEHFNALKQLKNRYSFIKAIEIMPYHSLGEHKRKQYGITLEEVYRIPSPEEVLRWKKEIEI